MATTIRVSESTHARVAALASRTGMQMQTVVEEAVSSYEASLFWDDFTTSWNRLSDDRAIWAKVRQERASEETTLRDALD